MFMSIRRPMRILMARKVDLPKGYFVYKLIKTLQLTFTN